MKTRLMIIDDEVVLRKGLTRFFESQSYEVFSFGEWAEAEIFLKQHPVDLLLVDLMLPQISGIEVMERLREIQPELVSIVMTGCGTIPSAVEAIRKGAFHYVTKPFDLEDIGSLVAKAAEHVSLKQENRRLKKELSSRFSLDRLVGQSSKMREVIRLAEKVAEADSTILILGESGTGKELMARGIHYLSKRAENAFIAVNCSAIPEGLLESELFGHKKGSFTGAIANQVGKFELAHQGTIFLDEIGDMSPQLQVKLLRVLQERVILPLGESKPREVNIRVVAATHQNLQQAIREGRFREDLYYRLNVISLTLPPLRERLEDLDILVPHFLKELNQTHQKNVESWAPEVMEIFQQYSWPGNVRELENLMERLIVLKGRGTIELKDLPDHLRQSTQAFSFENFDLPQGGVDFRELTDRFEKILVEKALEKSEGNQNQASKLLKMNRTTLIEKMKKWSKAGVL